MSGVIIVIESSDIGAEYTARAIKDLGYTPIFICNMNNYQADTKKQIEQHTWFQANTKSLQDVLDVIHENIVVNTIVGVVSLLDSRLKIAYQTAQALNVRGVDSTVEALSDKGYVAKLIAQDSPDSFVFNKNSVPLDELKSVLEKHKKIIVKPTRSAGAYGMFFIKSLSELAALQNKIEQENDVALQQGEWIAQPFITGRLVSLEGFILNNQITFLGFTSREKIDKTESAYVFPDLSVIEPTKLSCKKILTNLLTLAKFKKGYFHTEFIIDENDRPYLIDANIGRIGGSGIAQQIALAYGLSPVHIFKHVIATALFNDDPQFVANLVNFNKEPIPTFAVAYGVKNNCKLKSIALPSGHQFLHTQILDENTEIPAMGKDNWSWVGIAVGLVKEMEAISSIKLVSNLGTENAYFTDGDPKEFVRNCLGVQDVDEQKNSVVNYTF